MVLPIVVMDDEEDKSWKRHGEERQNQFLIQRIETHSPYDTMQSTFEKREESQSISLVTTTTDPAMTLNRLSSVVERLLNLRLMKKLWTTSCSTSLRVIVILDRYSSIDETLGMKDGSCSSTQKYFS
jgi:hypothetical protein